MFGWPDPSVLLVYDSDMTADTLPKINVKQATSIAAAHIKDLYGDQDAQNVLLEEVRFKHENNRWDVTIGFNRKATLPVSSLIRNNEQLRELLSQDIERVYKVVEVDGTSGAVLGMRMR